MGGLGGLLGRLGLVLECLGSVSGRLGPPWVAKGRFGDNAALHAAAFGRPKRANMRPKWDPRWTKSSTKKESKREALEDRLGATLGRSWVVLGAVLGS